MSKGSFFHSIKIVVSGMAIAQLLPLLASLAIARIYAPAQFGLFATWLGIVMSAAVIVTGRLEMAIGLEEDANSRKQAVSIILLTIVIISVALWILLIIGYFFTSFFGQFGHGLLIAFFPAVLLAGAIQTWQAWAALEGLYSELSYIRVAQSIGVTSIQIGVGFLAPNAESLALGYIFGLICGFFISCYLMPISSNYSHLGFNFFANLRALWVRHRRFPLFALPADFINTFAAQLPLIAIASRFGDDITGFYALTIRVLGAPISLMGAAVLDVFKKKSVESFLKYGNCRLEYIQALKTLSLLGIFFATLAALVSEPMFVWGFGEPWRQSGIIAVWMVPMFAMRFIASPLSYVLYIAGKQHVDLIWQISLLVMTATSLYLPDSFEWAIKSYAMGYAFLYFVYIALSYRYSKKGISDNCN